MATILSVQLGLVTSTDPNLQNWDWFHFTELGLVPIYRFGIGSILQNWDWFQFTELGLVPIYRIGIGSNLQNWD